MAAAQTLTLSQPGSACFESGFDPQQQRSCSNVITEPCVNKATALLQSLKTKTQQAVKTQLKPDHTRPKQTTSSVPKADVVIQRSAKADDAGSTEPRTATPRSILVRPPLHSGRGSSEGVSGEGLRVEGVSTGTRVEKVHHELSVSNDIIAVAIALVGRLEEDRLQTLAALAGERRRVWELGVALDAETEKRLDLLPRAVQSEHDECHCNVLELKWHVLFQQRQLTRLTDDLRTVSVKNAALKKDTDKLASNCPLLEEKLEIERDHMTNIASRQQERSEQLSGALHRLGQTEGQSALVHGRAASERRALQEELGAVGETLATATAELRQAQTEQACLDHKSADCRSRVADNQRQTAATDSQCDRSRSQLSVARGRAGRLREEHARMDTARAGVVAANERLLSSKNTEHAALDSEGAALLAGLHSAQEALRRARDQLEHMQQNIDQSKETIAACIKQTHDDDKSVERAHRELVKLDQQMGVSVSQFTKVKEENFTRKEEFKSEEARTGDIEHSLRSTATSLHYQLQQEGKSRTTLQSKVHEQSSSLEQLRREHSVEQESTTTEALQTQTQSEGKTDLVDRLEELLRDKQRDTASLRCQLDEVQGEHAATSAELGTRRDQLRPHEQTLRAGVQQSVALVDSVADRIKQLERRLEDVLKSTSMVEKMDRDTKAAILTLNDDLAVLTERLAVELDEEESWKKEHREISEFYSEAEAKYTAYVEERGELVKQCQLDLNQALSRNASLSSHYRQLQTQLVAGKGLALSVLERKLEKEAALRDHKQLLLFQSCLYSAVCEYYQRRALTSRASLQQLHSASQLNMAQLKRLHGKLQTTVSLLQEFLQSHERERAKLRPPPSAGQGRREHCSAA